MRPGKRGADLFVVERTGMPNGLGAELFLPVGKEMVHRTPGRTGNGHDLLQACTGVALAAKQLPACLQKPVLRAHAFTLTP